MVCDDCLEYDVVIMGAGFAGLCQARHLLLNIPDIRVALVDPRPEHRSVRDLKVGESTIEIASLFLAQELGLREYLIENHAPKQGLNFHWPKDPDQTETLDDYYHAGSNRQVPIPSYQINRARFEQDLLQMVKEMGGVFHQGQVTDVDLTPGAALKTVDVKIGRDQLHPDGQDESIYSNGRYLLSEEYRSVVDHRLALTAKHVIDAAGRRFIIGRKTDNILSGPENLMGLDTGSAWVRVKNVDRTLFHDGYDPMGASTSHYYATNHYFGHGHWIWMIPIDTEAMELSIGIVHHHQQLPAEQLNTREKFLGFLQANHTILAQIIESSDPIDFHYWPKLAHKSKTQFSTDNWYVIGDAAYIFDPFYSYGTSTIALSIEGVTEIIRAKLANEVDAEEKRAAYNAFNLAYARSVNCLYRGHDRQLGHASIMSWRIYFEYMWWFGVQVPMYVGKWHLDLTFIPIFLKTLNGNVDGLFADISDQFNQLVERDANIGLMDCYRADQLIHGYHPLKHFDPFLENTKLEPKHCNVFIGLRYTCFYVAIWYLKFQWQGFGWQGVLRPQSLYHFFRLLGLTVQAIIGEMVYKRKTRGLVDNAEVEEMRAAFKQYQYRPGLQPWIPNNS